jgi:hypothetical protein
MHSSWLRLIERMPIISSRMQDWLSPDPIRRTRGGLYAHHCPDWNLLLIDEGDLQFEFCRCFDTPTAAAYAAFWEATRKQASRELAFDRCWRD